MVTKRPLCDTQLREHDWSDDEEYLAFLALGGSEFINLYIIDLVNGETKTLPMSQPVTQIQWQPKQGGLSLLLLDNSIWYLPPGAETAVPLTESFSSISSLRWSPDGSRLAFISDTDLLILDMSAVKTQP
jgi:dipeptidyl aminopeptidase/acylaminoacyl peptidase